MRFTKLSALAIVAVSLIATDALASPVNRKFHPVVNDDPQNAHLNVQTPGADINQTVTITEEPGPDGQVIPAGDAKVAACALKDASGDIDLSGGGSCWSPKASAPMAAHAPVSASTAGQALSPIPRAVSRTVRVPSLTSASIAPAGNMSATKAAPNRTMHAVEAARVAAPLPAHRIENVRLAASSLSRKVPAPAARAEVVRSEFVRMQWLLIGAAAALLLLAVGLGILLRMGLGNLLLVRRDEEHRESEGRAAQDGRAAVSAVAHDPLPSP